MIWLVETRNSDGQHLGLVIPWAFDSKQAAQWWIDNRADRSMGWNYEAVQIPLYSLKDLQSFTA